MVPDRHAHLLGSLAFNAVQINKKNRFPTGIWATEFLMSSFVDYRDVLREADNEVLATIALNKVLFSE